MEDSTEYHKLVTWELRSFVIVCLQLYLQI